LQNRLIPLVLLFAASAACYLFYSFGFGAIFRFDDIPNLEGLASVKDLDSALNYVFGGRSSNIGRPLALTSFLINASSWPANPAGFLRFNTGLHLANGALVAWFAYKLLPASRGLAGTVPESRWPLAAASAAILWLLNPLLLSTSMMIVQRMTLLSATCVLATLIAYLAARERWFGAQGSWRAAFGLAAILGIGGGLGILFKETAFNLVIYVGLIEYLLLKRAGEGVPIKAFRWACVILPLAVFAAFVVINWSGFMVTFQMRDFTVAERVLSAPRILSDYLWHAFVPMPSWLGPYHDDFAASRGWLEPLSTLAAAIFWLVLAATAFLLRKRWPIFALAVFWFVGGHFLEAGPFGLELYFEHRNYLPLFGPMLLVGVLPWLTLPQFRRLVGAGVALFGLLLAFGLAQSASLWGRPFAVAEVWARSHPQSLRAAQYHAQSFFVRGMEREAADVVTAASERLPNSVGLVLAEIQLRCSLPDAGRVIPPLAERALAVAPAATFEFSALETVAKLTSLASEGRCPSLGAQWILDLSAALLANPKYRSRWDAVGLLHYQRGRLYFARRDLEATVREFDAAFAADPDVDTISLVVALLWDAGLPNEARARLDLARQRLPANRILRRQWMDKLGRLELLVGSK
jgi:tetratricopeptide (TPR) repeat protein